MEGTLRGCRGVVEVVEVSLKPQIKCMDFGDQLQGLGVLSGKTHECLWLATVTK